jgi:hypothetical protein
MCGTTSDQEIEGVGRSRHTTTEEDMYSNASVKAEVDYRRERLSRDFRHHGTTRVRRNLAHLFGKKA